MRKNQQEEFKIQAAFIQYVKLAHPTLLYTISPAGFIMSAGMAMKMVRMGYRKGTLDVMFFEPMGKYHGFHVEFKAPGGMVSKDQDEIILSLHERNYAAVICWNADDAIIELERYLRGEWQPKLLS